MATDGAQGAAAGAAREAGIGVGLVGLGTIGTGVVRILRDHATELAARLGGPLSLRAIADLDLETDRGVSLEGVRTTTDWRELVAAPDIDVILELVGGTGVARDIVLESLRAGKGVVTANKALLAHHGAEIYETAKRNTTEVLFEASVGGTIPILRALREGLCADRISAVHGIVNGTCNFILTEMEERGETYAACLERAQELGYAEADPTFDVDGTDSAHKLAILLGLAFGVTVPLEAIPTEGIERIAPIDLEYASEFDLRVKLLAIAKRDPRCDGSSAVEARVQPTLISKKSVLARVDGSMNAVEVHGVLSGPTLYYGAGAGSLPTASAVVADVMELGRNGRLGPGGRVPPLGTPTLAPGVLRASGDLEAEFYMRLTALDQPGVLGAICGVLGRFGIGIASLMQRERHESQAVPIVLMTHPTKESELRAALDEIERLREVRSGSQVMRIERDL